MIGLVLVTHGRLAAEFVTAMEHVVGPQDAIEAICIGPDDDMEGRRKDIASAIGQLRLKAADRWHFLQAWGAPGAPERRQTASTAGRRVVRRWGSQ